MKFCDLVQFYSPMSGGVRRYLEDKMRYFASMPDVEHFVVVPGSTHSQEIKHGSVIYSVKSLPLIGSMSYRMLLNRNRIHAIINNEKPDLIEVGDPYRSAWIAWEAAQQHQIPIVAFYHSDFPRALGRTIRRFAGKRVEHFLSSRIHNYIRDLYNRMDATVVASTRILRVLQECGIQRVVRIPLGTDVTKFQPSPKAGLVRKQLGLGEEDFLLLFVGRLAREKNIKNVIQTIKILNQDNQQKGRYHLLLVGDGEGRGYVEKMVQRRDDIQWFKFCTSTEWLCACYTAADLYVHAGIYETFGITSLEAQACGTRVLAVQQGGLDDSVAGESPLIMASSSQPHHLADAIQKIRHISGGATAEERRTRIVQYFSIQQTFNRLTALYQHLLSGQSADTFTYEGMKQNQHELYHPALFTR